MATRIAMASSQLEDIQEAAVQAANSIQAQLENDPPHLALVFTCAPYGKPEALETIAKFLQPERMLGCSVNGIMLSEQIFRRGIGILAIHSPEIAFGISYSHNVSGEDARTVGFAWARQMSTDC